MKKQILFISLAVCMVLALLPSGTVFATDAGSNGVYDVGADTGIVPMSVVDDHTPPIVTGVYMNSPGGTVKRGDTLYFDIKIEDESTIRNAELRFSLIEAQGNNQIWTRFESYDNATQIAKVSLTIQDNIANGTWKLNQVSVTDYYGNTVYNYPGNPDCPNSGNPGNINFSSIHFTVASNDIPPEKVSIPETIEVSIRSVYTIIPAVEPATSVPKWTWTSADTSIATVNVSGNGKTCNVTGVAPGTTTITGTTQNGLTTACIVTVTDAPVPDSGTIDESYQVGVGGYVDILPVLTPADATTLYEVTSDNPHVASVATTTGRTGVRIQGNVPGKATITIRGVNGLVMTTTVIVGKSTDTQHEKVTDLGYPATCTRPGMSERVRCSVCWYVFAEAKEIPATGEHTYGDWRVVQEATATTAGLKERYCTGCGNRETESIPSTGSSTNPGGTTTPGGNTNPGGTTSPSTGDYGWTPPAPPSQNISAGEQKLRSLSATALSTCPRQTNKSKTPLLIQRIQELLKST